MVALWLNGSVICGLGGWVPCDSGDKWICGVKAWWFVGWMDGWISGDLVIWCLVALRLLDL